MGDAIESKTLMGIIAQYQKDGIDPMTKESELWQRFGRRYAILFIDSTGFTRTTNKLGMIHFLSKLSQKRSIAIPILKKYICASYILESDSIVALFPDVQNAINATREIHNAIKAKKLMLSDDEPFQICAGIGYGDLLVTGAYGDFYGLEVNLASKLGEDSANAGELMLTEKAYAVLQSSEKETFIPQQTTVSGNHIPYYLGKM